MKNTSNCRAIILLIMFGSVFFSCDDGSGNPQPDVLDSAQWSHLPAAQGDSLCEAAPALETCVWKNAPDAVLIARITSVNFVETPIYLPASATRAVEVSHCDGSVAPGLSVEFEQIALLAGRAPSSFRAYVDPTNPLVAEAVSKSSSGAWQFAGPSEGAFNKGSLLGVTIYQREGRYDIGVDPLFTLNDDGRVTFAGESDECAVLPRLLSGKSLHGLREAFSSCPDSSDESRKHRESALASTSFSRQALGGAKCNPRGTAPPPGSCTTDLECVIGSTCQDGRCRGN